ncbi:hypothetical protein HYH03_007696 [Edaphochlamys debaryana]|uniref:Uncharacterized protein n=1 Tax=Edaphochlamys debaryana TaxID=47281 RepID=A0A836BZK6_9CHLO|nr:hypothetical protein HYH03_007696 [Edaphochlamys debaryana]|eukprot:KAG2494052.1 hypothetical protein HYH03_007696 [Edaphochlamys debaryana]
MAPFKLFKLPVDVYFLLVPVTAGLMGMVAMTSRIPMRDPEATRDPAFYEDEAHAAAVGHQYENGIRQMFDARIRAKKFSVFNNEMDVK